MTPAAIAFTRDPLPADGGYGVSVSLCGTCRAPQLYFNADGFVPPYTRSTEPDPRTGKYVVLPHLSWCPAWTDPEASEGEQA